jgi:hypothetical protein
MWYVIVTESTNTYDSVTVGDVSCVVPAYAEEWNVHSDDAGRKCIWFRVERSEAHANALAQHLVTLHPLAEIVITKPIASYQAEKPKVVRKEVSERGALPS